MTLAYNEVLVIYPDHARLYRKVYSLTVMHYYYVYMWWIYSILKIP